MQVDVAGGGGCHRWALEIMGVPQVGGVLWASRVWQQQGVVVNGAGLNIDHVTAEALQQLELQRLLSPIIMNEYNLRTF